MYAVTFQADFFRENRRRLATELDGGLVVLAGYDAMQQTNDQAGPFIQEANFWYLTGITWPKWHMVYDSARDKCWLVEPKRSVVEVTFDGAPDTAEMLKQSGADEIISEDEFSLHLAQCARSHATVYTFENDGDHSFVSNPAPRHLTERLKRIFGATINCDKNLRQLRAIKQPDEIRAIKRAIAITNEAYAAIIKNRGTYRYEYEIEAAMWQVFRSHNAQHAYEPIVASGKNATVLHYTNNAARLNRRELILMDFGARLDGYCADITRMVTLDEPTAYQNEVYELLLKAQRQMIQLIRPSADMREYRIECDKIMTSIIHELNLGDDSDALRRYFPHAVSHGLGIDVHDTLGGYPSFRPGMVLTVEPGIYIPEKHLGLRIEDNVLVTETGCKNLSSAIPVTLC